MINLYISSDLQLGKLKENYTVRSTEKLLAQKLLLKLVELARRSPLGSIAQSVEHRTGIPKVRVQIPLGPTIFPLASQHRFIMFTCCPEDDSNHEHIKCVYMENFQPS